MAGAPLKALRCRIGMPVMYISYCFNVDSAWHEYPTEEVSDPNDQVLRLGPIAVDQCFESDLFALFVKHDNIGAGLQGLR